MPIYCNHNTQQKKLVCDPEHITSLLAKSVTLLSQPLQSAHEEDLAISIVLEDTWLHYPLRDVAQGYIKQVLEQHRE